MIRIEALSQGGNHPKKNLDTLEDFSLILNMQVSEPGEFLQRRAPFSQQFQLPFTDTNNEYFGHFYRVDLTNGDFNPAARTDVRVYRDDVLILDGKLRLQAVRLTARVYSVSVQSDSANLFSVMGTKLLIDAFATPSDYDFEMKGPQVRDSQVLTNDITDGSVGAGIVWVPLMDHGLSENGLAIFKDGFSGLGSNDMTLASTVKARQMKPCISVRHLIQKIIYSNGYVYDSDWLDSTEITKLYMTLADHLPQYPNEGVGGFKLGTAQNSLFSTGAPWFAPSWNDSSSADFYNDGVFSSGGFVAPADGTYTFDYSLQLEFIQVTGYFYVRFNVGGTIYHQQQQYVGSTTNAFVMTKTNMSVTMNQGDILLLECRATNGAQVRLTPQMFTSSGSYSYFKVDPFVGSNFDVKCHTLQGLPNLTQQDFFRDIMQRFNLMVYSDFDDSQVIRIEPYSDWIAAGQTQDWTEYLDLDKEQTVMSTSQLRKKTILLGDLESKDVGNQYFQDFTDAPFGQFRQDVIDEYATGELTNAPVFAPMQMFTIPTIAGDPNTEDAFILIHRAFEDTGDGVKPVATPPKLFFATGLDTDFNGTIRVSVTQLTQYQMYGPYADRPCTNSSTSLYWQGAAIPFGQNGLAGGGSAIPQQGLYGKYWSKYLAQYYADDSRIYEAYLTLPPEVISKLRFNDVYIIKGNAYLLQKLAGYDAANPSHAKCTFLRETGELQIGGCTLSVSGIGADFEVSFQDAAGNPQPATQVCCEANGYYFDSSNGLCYQYGLAPPPSPGGVGGSTPDGVVTGGGAGLTNAIVAENEQGNSMARVTPDSRRELFRNADRSLSVRETFELTAITLGSGTSSPVDRREAIVNFVVPPEHTGVMIVQATTRQTGGSAGTIGDTCVQEFRATISGDGTPSATINKITGSKAESQSGLDVTMAISINANGECKFGCTGEANKELQWTLNCQLTRTLVNSELENVLTTEAGALLLTNAGANLIQE